MKAPQGQQCSGNWKYYWRGKIIGGKNYYWRKCWRKKKENFSIIVLIVLNRIETLSRHRGTRQQPELAYLTWWKSIPKWGKFCYFKTLAVVVFFCGEDLGLVWPTRNSTRLENFSWGFLPDSLPNPNIEDSSKLCWWSIKINPCVLMIHPEEHSFVFLGGFQWGPGWASLSRLGIQRSSACQRLFPIMVLW